jgi:Flp pilus assembly protein TadD
MPQAVPHLSIGEALDLGCQLAMSGNNQDAEGLFRGVLIHDPQNFEAISRLGSALFEQAKVHEALYWFWRAKKVDRKQPLALGNYGMCLCQLGHLEEGVADLRRAVYQAGKVPSLSNEARALIYNNLGNTLEKLGEYPEALTVLEQGVLCNPGDGFPHYNRGIVLLRLGRHREAIASFDRAIAIEADDADAHYNRSMAKLLLGEIKEAGADFEYRMQTTEVSVPHFGMPIEKKWQGQPLDGARILVHCEQGLGDTIQFLRFLPELWRRGARSIPIIVHNAIKPLIKDAKWPGELEILEPGTPLQGRYDYWTALMSIPHFIGMDEAGIPPPWTFPMDRERVHFNPPRFGGKTIGVCWRGNFRHKNDRHRSIPINLFSKLFETEATFVGLQQLNHEETGAVALAEATYPNFRNFEFTDFRDTAAAIGHLDLVISVDTAVAHLASTLGAPTWTLIPKFGSDWRWQLGREDSPWYPSMRLIRQIKVGDWESVIRRIAKELGAEVQIRAA